MAAAKTSSVNGSVSDGSGQPEVPWDRVERFVGQLVHDVRNGLNALELQLTFLGEISTDPEAVDEIKRLRGTLGNVTRQLQTLRCAVGTTTAYPLDYPTGDFLDDLRERFVKLHPGADGRLAWESTVEAETLLSVDPELTLNALLELLTNALHFAPAEGPLIRVLVSADGEHTLFLLQESRPVEPAIPLENWGRAPLLTTRRGAYGLGLFGVRRCLEAQGGSLNIEYSTDKNILTTTVMLRNVPPPQP